MNNIKFVVKVNHRGTRAPGYVQSIARMPFQITSNLKLALIMGKFAAEDAAKAIQNSQRTPELVPIRVHG